MQVMDRDIRTPGERLRHLRKMRGFDSAERLARVVDRSTSTVIAHENGDRNIPYQMARKYARALGTSIEAILNGRGFNQVTVNATINNPTPLASTGVPLLSCTDVEQFRSIASGADPMSDNVVFPPSGLKAGTRVFVVKASDPSMECASKEGISEGEDIYIDPDQLPISGKIVAALAPGFDRLILRKYRVTAFDGEGKPIFDLIALNPDYPSVLGAQALDVQIIGRVIGMFRSH
jgi:SOS-response transcriptional repressor LexA